MIAVFDPSFDPEHPKYRDPRREYYISKSRCPSSRCGREWFKVREANGNADARQDAAVDRCPFCGFDAFNIWPKSTKRYRGGDINV